MANDSFVQLPTDGPGKEVDTSELTVAGNTVQRQRVVLASDDRAASLAEVTLNNELSVADPSLGELLAQILLELKSMRLALVYLACSGNEAKMEDFDPLQADAGSQGWSIS